MRVLDTKFIKSIASIEDYLLFSKEDKKKRVCVVGRSNVGKSSFINLITERKKLAKTSQTPGRTRLINLFDFSIAGENQKMDLVLIDLPGYGYAKAAKSEIKKWGDLVDNFFTSAKDISLCFVLVDIRHPPSSLDQQMVEFLAKTNIGFSIIATKQDKISNSQTRKHIQILANELKIGVDNIIPTSAAKNLGKAGVLERLFLLND